MPSAEQSGGTLAAAPLMASASYAATLVGLVDGKTLVWVDPATKKVTGKADIKGATSVVGIDVRPADGMLYAVTAVTMTVPRLFSSAKCSMDWPAVFSSRPSPMT